MEDSWARVSWVKEIIGAVSRSVVFGSDEECPIIQCKVGQTFGLDYVTVHIIFKSRIGQISICTLENTTQSIEALVSHVLQSAEQALVYAYNQNSQGIMSGTFEIDDTVEEWLIEHKKYYGK